MHEQNIFYSLARFLWFLFPDKPTTLPFPIAEHYVLLIIYRYVTIIILLIISYLIYIIIEFLHSRINNLPPQVLSITP